MADNGGGQNLQDKIAYLQAITGFDDPDLCTEILSAHNWDLHLAISAFTSDLTPTPPSNPNPPNSPGIAWKLITLPFYAVSGVVGLLSRTVGIGFWIAAGALSRSLNLLGLLPPNSAAASSSSSEAAALIAAFEREFGSQRRPNFASEGFMEALQRSQREFKLMFVYLHSPDHPDVPEFCARCLCSEVVVEFVNENFVVWGGSIRGTEGFKMGNSLTASRFPFSAVVVPTSNQQIRLLAQVTSKIVF